MHECHLQKIFLPFPFISVLKHETWLGLPVHWVEPLRGFGWVSGSVGLGVQALINFGELPPSGRSSGRLRHAGLLTPPAMGNSSRPSLPSSLWYMAYSCLCSGHLVPSWLWLELVLQRHNVSYLLSTTYLTGLYNQG